MGDSMAVETEHFETIDGTEWRVVLHWAEVGGRAEAVGLEMRSGVSEPIKATTLRRLSIGTMIAEGRLEVWNRHWAVTPGRDFALDPYEEQPRTGPGRPAKYDARHYREVARVYQSAYRRGSAPTQAVAQHFGVSASMAAKLVFTARNTYGLLAPATKGRAAGAPQDEDELHEVESRIGATSPTVIPPSNTGTGEQLRTVREGAERLRLSPSMIRKLVRAGALPAVRVGRAVRIRERDLDAFVLNQVSRRED